MYFGAPSGAGRPALEQISTALRFIDQKDQNNRYLKSFLRAAIRESARLQHRFEMRRNLAQRQIAICWPNSTTRFDGRQ